MRTLYALTLHRPWTDAIFAWPGKHAKRVENRTWYRASLVGHYFAIHAGKRYDRDGAAMVAELAKGVAEQRPEFTWRCPGPAESPEGIVGVARLCGVIDAGADGEPRAIAGGPGGSFSWGEWWMGGIGWLLDDVTAIEPVPCKGAQGLWVVPPDAADEVRRRWLDASSSRGSARGSEAPDPRILKRARRFERPTFSLGRCLPTDRAGEDAGFPEDLAGDDRRKR